MKRDAVSFAIALIAFTALGAAEELCAKPFGIGFPFLLVAAIYFAERRTALHAILFAVAAGAAVDALSSLPPAVSLAFFAAVAAVVRATRRNFPSAKLALALAYPVYQFWLWMWCPNLGGAVFTRSLAAAPLAVCAAVAVYPLLEIFERKGAVDEP